MPTMTVAGSTSSVRTSGTRETFIAQVVGHLTDDILTVWALDAQRSYRAHGFRAADWSVGQIVRCSLSNDGRTVDDVTSTDNATQEAYREKRLIP